MTQYRAIIADFDFVRTITFNDSRMAEEFGQTLQEEYEMTRLGTDNGFDTTVVYYPKFVG